MPELVMEREMRELRARLDAMKIAQRCIVDIWDISEANSKDEDRHEE
jgi:hypothetical protein